MHPVAIAGSAATISEIQTGSSFDNRASISIGELFDDPAAFENRHVRIAGIVGDQDPAGHWLYLDDQTARIYIDTPIAIQQLHGKIVTISGIVEVAHGIPSVVAKEVK